MDLPHPPEWSKKKLRATGDAIRDGLPVPVGAPTVAEALAWFEDLASAVHFRLEATGWPPGLMEEVTITHRTKSIDTIREKLLRERGSNLPTMRDVAGVRLVGRFPTVIQTAIPKGLELVLPEFALRVVDRRTDPKSGYRALHVEASVHGYSCEIQIRTHLQAAWANTFESIADTWGRQIRYGGDPDGFGAVFDGRQEAIRNLQKFSTSNIRNFEDMQDRWFNLCTRLGLIEGVKPDEYLRGWKARARRVSDRRVLRRLGREIDQMMAKDLDFLDLYESLTRTEGP